MKIFLWILFCGFGVGYCQPLACYYKSTEYFEGDTILLEDPCLSCTCSNGTLDCSSRVCQDYNFNDLPIGCQILTSTDKCCPFVMCDEPMWNISDNEKDWNEDELSSKFDCEMNGFRYTEGSRTVSNSSCDSCYCLQGKDRCVSSHCPTPLIECEPVYSDSSCCPTSYQCYNSEDPFEEELSEVLHLGCTMSDGAHYSHGVSVPTSEPCISCYCLNGTIECAPIQCTILHTEGCHAVFTYGECCPSYYNCTRHDDNQLKQEESRIVLNVVRSLDFNDTITNVTEEVKDQTTTTGATESETTTIMSEATTTTTMTMAVTTTEKELETTVFDDDVTTELITTEDVGNWSSTTTDGALQETTLLETTESELTTTPQDIITAPPQVVNVHLASNLRMNNQTADGEERAGPGDAEELLNSTKVEEDYDSYDYNEPKLPPSLPNLVIFPFLAADAVTKNEEPGPADVAEKKSDSGIEVAEPAFNHFSPPEKTEGGFVPKDDPIPIPETVTTYVSYFENVGPVSTEAPENAPSITMPPKSETEMCVSEGKEYKHGEQTSAPEECISCVCFYGEVICQEPACPTPPSGCTRSSEKEEHSCCGKIICVDMTTAVPNVTEVTLEPIVISEIDVIHTEPAPDLASLKDEILPFLMDQQTHKPVNVNYKNVLVSYYPKHQVTTTLNQQKTTMTIEETPMIVRTTEPYRSKWETSMSPVYRHTTDSFDTTFGQRITTERTRPLLGVRPKPTTEGTLLGVRPKPTTERTLLGVRNPTTTTTTESDFLGDFLKGFFETENETTTSHPPPKLKYSSKIKAPPPLSTTTSGSIEIIRTREGANETNSFSFDSVLDMLFNSENETVKPVSKPKIKQKKPLRRTKKPVKTTTPVSETTNLETPFAENRSDFIKETETTLEKQNVAYETNFSVGNVTDYQEISNTTQVEQPELIKRQENDQSVGQENTPPKVSEQQENKQPGFSQQQENKQPGFSQQENKHPSFSQQENKESGVSQKQENKHSGVTKQENLQSGVSQQQENNQHGFSQQQENKQSGAIKQENKQFDVSKQPETSRTPSKAPGGLGMLKLAGCNIYGRMYRVGKIIVELTNSCIECMCTETGVQCSKIVC